MKSKKMKSKSDPPIFLRRTVDGFTFRSELDRQTVSGRFGVGAVCRAELTKPRSGKQQRFYWSLLRAVFEQQARYPSVEMVHKAIKYELGLFDAFVTHDGKTVIEFEHTDYDSMDGGQFHEHVQRTIDFVSERIVPGLDAAGRDELLKRVHAMLGPFA